MADYDRSQLTNARRIVVKIGTNTLTDPNGDIDTGWLADFANQVKRLYESETPSGQKREVLIVSSGAIGAGCIRMNLKQRPMNLPQRQAIAAIGQVSLMRDWEKALQDVGLMTGQILLTKAGLNDREQYLNARNTINALLDFNAVPVINENDTVAVDEIKIGDNDTLSGHVTLLTDADLLILLTDQDGLLDQNPKQNNSVQAERIGIVTEIDDKIKAVAGDNEGSEHAVGGMMTKLTAARMVTESGVSMVIAPGRKPDLLMGILAGEDIGTWFPPTVTRLQARKRWIAFSRDTSGQIVVDAGARGALVDKGKSLLAVGIKDLSGGFRSGDSVDIVDEAGNVTARGLVNYAFEELKLIIGLRKDEIQLILHDNTYDCVVHRDNLVIVDE